jgi:hypothetical protein
MKRSVIVAFLLGLSFIAVQALAGSQITILVADKASPAYEFAKKQADDKTIFAERKLHKALSKAAELIQAKKKCPMPKVRGLAWPKCDLPEAERYWTVTVKVAQGDYVGKGGKGGFGLPELIAPDTTLRILGGYDDTFSRRAPFDTPTVLAAGGTIFALAGKNPMLKEFYLSGFVMDIGGGNSYDAKTNSLLRGTSANVAHLALGYLETDRLVIADNVFVNSSHKAAAPLIRAHDDKAEVIIRNNFVLNNILAWEADSARFKQIPARYVIEGNSFILNWPYNPDPTTGNPAALQLAGKYAAGQFVIQSNLFAHNIGGAIYWTGAGEKAGPKTQIKDNLFFNNGGLFEEKAPGAAAVVTKFGGFKSRDIPWNAIDVETLEDDFEWDSSGNQSFDPKVPITMVKPGFANSNAVSAENTQLNDVRGILGLNKSGGKVKISNYAPRMGIDLKNLPFPAEAKAAKYGVSRARVEQF